MKEASMLIRVGENEFKPLLDRDRALIDVNRHLRPWLDLIRDVTNYGTNLIPRCFSSSEKKFKDVVVIGILLRQVVAMLDSVEILLSQGAPHPANLQMRALFEAYVYIEWILESDAEKKASYYYVHNLRRKRLWASRTQPGSPEAQEFAAIMGKLNVQVTQEAIEAAKRQIQEIDRVLSDQKFVPIGQDFEKHRKGKRDPAWYVPLGEKSFAAVTRAVHKEFLYVYYSLASEVTHTSTYDPHVSFAGDKVMFEPIRYLKGFESVLRFSLSVALLTYMRILREYRPGELPAFGRKYKENWQKEFMNFLNIKYAAEAPDM
jgi:hypothetical protein